VCLYVPPPLQFDARRRASPDAAVEPFIRQSVQAAGLLDKVFGGQPPKLSTQVRLAVDWWGEALPQVFRAGASQSSKLSDS
jgi:hypothetical protein